MIATRAFLSTLVLSIFIGAAAAADEPLHISDVDEYLTRMAAFGLNGGVVVMDRGRIVLEKGYGLAERARNVPITPDTLFDIGSITKTYTGTAILQLVDAGKLSLDDTLPRFFANVPEDKRAITIRHLLTHTAGLPLYSGGDYELTPRAEMVKRTLEPKARFAPGSKWEYCNTCYQLLTVILEDLTGEPYEKYVFDHLLAPNGIRETGSVIPDFLGRPIAHGYRGSTDDGSPLDKAWYGDGPSWNLRGAGGFLAPLRDLAKWDRALRGTSESVRKLTLTPVIETGHADNEKMTYGWFYRDTAQGRMLSHSGGNGFFAVNLRRYVDRDVVIVYGTNNSRYDYSPAEREVAARLFGASKAAMPPAATPTTAAQLQRAGRYRSSSGDEVELLVDRGQLILDSMRNPSVIPLLGRPAKALDTPRARELEASAKSLMTAVGKGDLAPLLKALPPDVVPAEETQFWNEWLDEHRQSLGSFVGSTPLWTIEEGDELHTYVILSFERGGELVVHQQKPKGVYLYVGRPVLPEVYRFVRQSENELVTWNPYLELAGKLKLEKDAVVIGGVRFRSPLRQSQ